MADYIDAVPDSIPQDAGNSDDIGDTVTASISTAHARLQELVSDLYGTGSTVGDLMPMPVIPDHATAASGPEMDNLFPAPPNGE